MADFDENEILSITSQDSIISDDDGIIKAGAVRKKTVVAKKIENPDEESDISDVESDIHLSDESEEDSDYDEIEGEDGPMVTRDFENTQFPDMDMDDDDAEEDDDYFKKLDEDMQENILQKHHPELIVNNYEEIDALCTIVRDKDGMIIDPLHKTIPYVTRYEKARVLGERAKQINAGSPPFIEVEENIIEGYLIALREFENKKIPFIIQRPLPNGGCEYWRLRDLEIF